MCDRLAISTVGRISLWHFYSSYWEVGVLDTRAEMLFSTHLRVESKTSDEGSLWLRTRARAV